MLRTLRTSPRLRSLDHLSFGHGLNSPVSKQCDAQTIRARIPVFIMTCVVARPTFFLNPALWLAPPHGGVLYIPLPAQDMMIAGFRL